MGRPIYKGITLPETLEGWFGLLLGVIGSILWCTQFVWDWYGSTDADKAGFSLLILFIMITACASTYVANKLNKGVLKGKTSWFSIIKIVVEGFFGIVFVIIVINIAAQEADATYAMYALNQQGIFTGFKQLSSITSEDVNSLQNFALGLRQIINAMFLTVPCLIATWGGLSVLTADSISDAEGGILAIVAAFVVFIVVWIFKAIDVTLMALAFGIFEGESIMILALILLLL